MLLATNSVASGVKKQVGHIRSSSQQTSKLSPSDSWPKQKSKTLIKGIKREAEEDEEKLVETKHNVVKKAKRRKKASY
jgi:hypothetical protein